MLIWLLFCLKVTESSFIDFQYQSINCYRLISISIDFDRLTISSIAYAGFYNVLLGVRFNQGCCTICGTVSGVSNKTCILQCAGLCSKELVASSLPTLLSFFLSSFLQNAKISTIFLSTFLLKNIYQIRCTCSCEYYVFSKAAETSSCSPKLYYFHWLIMHQNLYIMRQQRKY